MTIETVSKKIEIDGNSDVKQGGRKKGAPNKRTVAQREIVASGIRLMSAFGTKGTRNLVHMIADH